MTGAVYILKESIEGFRRARVSTFISVFAVAFLLVIVGAFLIVTFNLNRILDVIHSRVGIEVFIDNAYDDSQIRELEKQISLLEAVETVEFISKEKAAQVFREEFGSDVFDILEDNPLPSSFRIKLAKEFRTLDEIEQVVKQLQELSGVDDVVYRGNVIQALDKYTRYANIINIVFLVFVFLGSLFMVSNTTRLIINAKKNIIDAMRLVGATRLFLRIPFLIEGIIQGLLGGIIAMLLLYAFVNIFDLKISGLLIVDNYILILLIVTGLLFGFFGSLFATYRFLDK